MPVKANLPLIPHGERPKILFLGNGINQLFGGKSWNDIISGFAREFNAEYGEKVYKSMPAAMQIIAATQGHVHTGMNALGIELQKLPVIEEQRSFLQEVLALPFEQILTTNYTFEIEETLAPGWNRNKYNKNIYCSVDEINSTNDLMLHSFCQMKEKYIWHIHGHAYKPSLIIMGQYYYGKLISQMQSYSGKLMKRYKASLAAGNAYRPLSWLDYFLIGDVYMLGFGMDLSEMDIWWLACCKQRNIPESRIHFFTRALPEEKRVLMEAYGIERHVIPTEEYGHFYREAIKEIGRLLSETEPGKL